MHLLFLQLFDLSAHGDALHRSQVCMHFHFFLKSLHLATLHFFDLSTHFLAPHHFFLHLPTLNEESCSPDSSHDSSHDEATRRRAPAARACSEGEGEGDCLRVLRVKVEW